MIKFLLSFCLVLWSIGNLSAQDLSNPTSTYFFIRHAEKDLSDPSNKNPLLTEEGKSRADHWAAILSEMDVDMIFSTDYHRTLQTAKPIAESKKLEVVLYDPRNLNDAYFLEKTTGKKVVVVGHSNTTPAFVNAILGRKKHESIDEKDYGKLFIVTVSGKTATDIVLNIN